MDVCDFQAFKLFETLKNLKVEEMKEIISPGTLYRGQE